MEFFQENTLIYNITAGIIVLVLFLLVLKLIKSVGKTVLILVGVGIVGYGIMKFYPEVAEPVIEFVNGGWMNSN